MLRILIILQFYVCFVRTVNYKGGKHFYSNNQHQSDSSRKYLQNIYKYYLSDNKSMLNYTRWFFSPSSEGPNSAGLHQPPTYIFQNKDRSQLYKKSPQLYNSLTGVSVDFYNKDDDILDPYSNLHNEEEILVRENPLQVSPGAMFLNIRDVFSQSKSGRTNEKIGTFLYRKLGRSGLVLYLQTFQYKKWDRPNIQESGVNVVGILPGKYWRQSQDKPLVISTYWDIQGAESEDYGSNLAMMMETVRILMLDPSYKPDYTVIFAAFDKRNDGSMGSKRFIQNYLEPYILNKYQCSVQGIINLESLIKFSRQNNSQKLPVGFYSKNPELSFKIMSQGGKGDFLAALTRGGVEEEQLASRFQKNLYRYGYKQKTFSFENLNSDYWFVDKIETFSDVWSNDLGRFWFLEESKNIPVISLTDTAIYRKAAGLQNISMMKKVPMEVLVLKSATDALLSTIRELTISNYISEKQLPMNNPTKSYSQVYNLLKGFILDFSQWQRKIEKKLSHIEASHKTSINNKINLFQDNRSNDTYTGDNSVGSAPYYVIIGDKPTNVERLNTVIENYYRKNTTFMDQKIHNSPMIIKLVN